MIHVSHVSKIYKTGEVETVALNDVSFNIKKGEFVAIMGPSGSGKSTLMHILGALDTPTTGSYILDGEEVAKLTDDELADIRNRKIGFVFQSYNLLARTSVLDNVLLPTIYTPNLNKKKTEKKALDLLNKVGLSERIGHNPNQLSGGEQQRVAIVRALINKPRLILADEPTGNLDSKSGQEVMEILQDLNEDGHTILMVTHEKYVAECARRIMVLKDGKIISDEKVGNQHLAKNGLKK